MSATTTPTQSISLSDAWLETSGLNAGDVAQARTHMHNAERIVDTLFALAEGLHLGPARIDHAPGSSAAHIRSI
jgi:hypothetical protein